MYTPGSSNPVRPHAFIDPACCLLRAADNRMNSVPGVGGRMTPFDLSVRIEDASGATITMRPAVRAQICTMVDEIYLWSPQAWRAALGRLPALNATIVLATKSNRFWETIAQELAERIFDAPNFTSPIDTFGPVCLTADGVLRPACRGGISDAHKVTISTFIDGRRDPLNLVTRRITMGFISGQWPLHESSEVFYRITFPSGKPQASPYHEHLDWRPVVNGRRLNSTVVVTAINEPWAAEIYPDFARLAVPLRHLLLQGQVTDPRRAQTNESYLDVPALRQAFAELIARMRLPPSSASVAEDLRVFLVPKYYCAPNPILTPHLSLRMIDIQSSAHVQTMCSTDWSREGSFADGFERPPAGYASGVAEFAAYLLPSIASGWQGAFSNITLLLEPMQD